MENTEQLVAGFKDLITKYAEPEVIRKNLTNLFMNYSRHVIRNHETHPVGDADNELYYLGLFIELLDGA